MTCKHQTLPKGHYCSFCGEMLIEVCELYISDGKIPCVPRCKSCKDWGESKKCEEKCRCLSSCPHVEKDGVALLAKDQYFAVCPCKCHLTETHTVEPEHPLVTQGRMMLDLIMQYYSSDEIGKLTDCKPEEPNPEGIPLREVEFLGGFKWCRKPPKPECDLVAAVESLQQAVIGMQQREIERMGDDCCEPDWEKCRKEDEEDIAQMMEYHEADCEDPNCGHCHRPQKFICIQGKKKGKIETFTNPKLVDGKVYDNYCGKNQNVWEPYHEECDTYTRGEIDEKLCDIDEGLDREFIRRDSEEKAFRTQITDILARAFNRPMFDYEAGMLGSLRKKFL